MSDIEFDFTEDDFKEGFSQPSVLDTPYAGPAVFKKITLEDRLNPRDETEIWDSVSVELSIPGNRVFRESFYAPKDKDEAKHTWRRIGNVVNVLLGDPKAADEHVVPYNSWNKLRAHLAEVLKDVGEKNIQVKIVGHFYNGATSVRFAYYPFASADSVLTFSKKEKEGNETWREARDAKPTDMGGGDGESAPVVASVRQGF